MDEIEVEDYPQAPAGIPDHVWAEALNRWLRGHIYNSPISRNVEALNYLGTAIHKLKTELDNVLRSK